MSTNYIAPIWRMPENTNNTPDDKLSNYSIEFDGGTSSQAINCGTGDDVNITGPISISVWFNTNNLSSSRGIVCKNDNNISKIYAQYLLEILNTTLRWRAGRSDVSYSIQTNQWYHAVGTYDGSNITLYVNGAQVATAAASSTSYSSAQPMYIGRRLAQSYFGGQIAQVCIFDYALTDGTGGTTDQIDYLYNLNNPMAITGGEPVAYWPLGDNSNPNANAGYPNISVGTDSVFNFASSESIRITDTGKAPTALQSIGNENSYTVAGWVNTTSSSTGGSAWFANDTFIDFRQQRSSGARVPFSIGMDNGEVSFGRSPNYTSPAERFTSTGTINDGNWHHIACTVNVNSLKIYIDGSLDSSHTFTSPSGAVGDCSVSTLNSNLQLGARSTDTGGLTSYASGDYSNFQIWDTELLAADVTTLYNNGQPLMTGTQPQEANLQAWYKLNQTANWEADVVGAWQVPDNRSAYPQSFTFLPGSSSDSVNSPGYYNFTGDFTISVWAKAHDPISSTYGMIFAIGSPGFSPPAGPGAYFAFQKNNLKFIWDDSSTGVYRSSNNTFQYEEWVHIVLVKEGSASNNLQMYINGQADPTTGTSTVGVQGQLTLGRWLGSTAFRLDGNISNFQFWDTALSAAQALTLYNDGTPLTSAIETENLQGWWKLDNTATWDGNEWDFPDLSGNAQTLRSNAMTEQNLANDNVSGLNAQSSGMDTTNLVQSNLTRTQPYSNYSFNFDSASSDYINCGDSNDFSFTTGSADLPFSVSAWVNFDDMSSVGGIISKYGSSLQEWVLYIAGPSTSQREVRLLLRGNSNNQFVRSTTYVAVDQWFHIVATYDGRGGGQANEGINIYINGGQETLVYSPTLGSPNSYTNMSNTTQPVLISTYGFSGNNDGKISNVAIFDRELTNQEALNIYNNGVPQDLQTASSFSNNIVAWWPMDQRSSYYDGTNWVVRDLENGNDGTGVNTGNVNDLVGNAPGSDANGSGTNLTIADLKGDMSNSDKNAYSINMGDYADGVTNPADSGRSTNIPSV